MSPRAVFGFTQTCKLLALITHLHMHSPTSADIYSNGTSSCDRRSDNDPLSPAERVRVARLRQELGDGEGVTGLLTASLRDSESGGDGLVEPPELLSPPSSPRQRYHTFGATLDFIEVGKWTACQG